MAESFRIRPLREPVELEHDGERLLVERGEPLAFGLLAAGRLVLARSPKLHRPRGPFCMSGACDGCLARVDGVPNVMTCLTPARGGERIETQNVVFGRELDVLGAADFFFPQGFDHHRLLAGVPGASKLLVKLARRLSGLGTLPAAPVVARPARRSRSDVLIVGGGAAGLCAARELGARALLVEERARFGGSLALLAPERAEELAQAARASGAALRSGACVLSLSRESGDSGALLALIVDAQGAHSVLCQALILASGCHDRTPRLGNNDLPGIYASRAALALVQAGVLVGRRVGLLGEDRFTRGFRAATGEHAKLIPLAAESIHRAKGRARVRRVVVEQAGRMREIVVDALLSAGPGAARVELGVQAGARVRFDAELGYVFEQLSARELAPGVFAAGSCAAGHGDGRSSAEQGTALGRHVASLLG